MFAWDADPARVDQLGNDIAAVAMEALQAA